MTRYLAYKDSGTNWIGEVPEKWESKRLRFLVRNIIERTNDVNYVIALENIESYSGKVLPIENSFEPQGELNRFQKDDILFSKLRPYLSKVHLTLQSGSCVGELLVLRPENYLTSGFLFYRLISRSFIEIVNSSTYGTKMPRASWENFIRNLIIYYPAYKEQIRIASFLNHRTHQIDNLIAKKQRLIELLQEERTALINQAVTKGLDPHVPMKDSGIEWLGEIPEHWTCVKLKSLGAIRYGLGQPPKSLENGLPLIRATNIQKGRIVTNEMLYVDPNELPMAKNPILKKGEIIIVRSGAYTGDSAIIPSEFEGAVAGYDMVFTPVKCKPTFLSFCFLSHYILENQLIPASSRAAQPHLNAEELGSTIIACPPIEEQMRISTFLKSQEDLYEMTYIKVIKEIDLLNEYKTSLINEAVTGKIDVRDYPVNHA